MQVQWRFGLSEPPLEPEDTPEVVLVVRTVHRVRLVPDQSVVADGATHHGQWSGLRVDPALDLLGEDIPRFQHLHVEFSVVEGHLLGSNTQVQPQPLGDLEPVVLVHLADGRDGVLRCQQRQDVSILHPLHEPPDLPVRSADLHQVRPRVDLRGDAHGRLPVDPHRARGLRRVLGRGDDLGLSAFRDYPSLGLLVHPLVLGAVLGLRVRDVGLHHERQFPCEHRSGLLVLERLGESLQEVGLPELFSDSRLSETLHPATVDLEQIARAAVVRLGDPLLGRGVVFPDLGPAEQCGRAGVGVLDPEQPGAVHPERGVHVEDLHSGEQLPDVERGTVTVRGDHHQVGGLVLRDGGGAEEHGAQDSEDHEGHGQVTVDGHRSNLLRPASCWRQNGCSLVVSFCRLLKVRTALQINEGGY